MDARAQRDLKEGMETYVSNPELKKSWDFVQKKVSTAVILQLPACWNKNSSSRSGTWQRTTTCRVYWKMILLEECQIQGTVTIRDAALTKAWTPEADPLMEMSWKRQQRNNHIHLLKKWFHQSDAGFFWDLWSNVKQLLEHEWPTPVFQLSGSSCISVFKTFGSIELLAVLIISNQKMVTRRISISANITERPQL